MMESMWKMKLQAQYRNQQYGLPLIRVHGRWKPKSLFEVHCASGVVDFFRSYGNRHYEIGHKRIVRHRGE